MTPSLSFDERWRLRAALVRLADAALKQGLVEAAIAYQDAAIRLGQEVLDEAMRSLKPPMKANPTNEAGE
jgi:hypothetical protein